MCAWVLQKRHSLFEPFTQTFEYTGASQTIIIPSTGIYSVEMYGGSGGKGHQIGGAKGAYVLSYHKLYKGDTYYIYVGGVGTGAAHTWDESSNSRSLAGGYNGGGTGYYTCSNNYRYASYGAGGGATHMSKEKAILPSTQNVDNIICVAGGGGGGAQWIDAEYGDGSKSASATASSNGTLGRGTAYSSDGASSAGAGGGGRYGGNRSYAGTNLSKSYGVYTAVETQGVNSGNGKLILTRVE